MLRVGSWLYGKKPAANTQSLDSLTELRDREYSVHSPLNLDVVTDIVGGGAVEDAMKAATLILNDDVDGAEDGLSEGVSSFHNVSGQRRGRIHPGDVRFRAGGDASRFADLFSRHVGFSLEWSMTDLLAPLSVASERLNAAENTAYNDQQKAQHNSHAPNSYHSQIYVPGTEFALCQAMAQLMSAVVGVLNESLTESIKGFYKLRKAYITLDGILKMEQKFMQLNQSGGTTPTELLQSSSRASGLDASANPDANSSVEAAGLSQKLSDINVSSEEESTTDASSTKSPADMLSHDPDSDIFKNEIDVFVHSGANFCFGILLLLISMVPPAFSKLLGIIGFHGDKERGLRMLWQASKFHNLIGAIAAFAILGYYNGFVRYCDIMPDPVPGDDADVQGYPQERLESLLAKMRQRFPKSQLWLLEESRMEGANKNLERALELLCGEEKSPLQQVEALRVFERSLNAMYLHRHELCAKSFLECVDLNSWSRSLYYYIAGSSHLSLYRSSSGDAELAAKHAEKATEYYRMAPPLAGKKRFMARQLPFDIFVTRKIAKWEARAKEWKVPLVDAVGVDPIEEMIFFWNGHSRMTTEQLEESLQNLAWSENDANKKNWSREGPEEKAILQLLRAAVWRSMRKHDQARKLIQDSVLSHDKTLFTGHLKDNWVQPAAHFEMAANMWMERPNYIAVHGDGSGSPPAETTKGEASSATPLEKQKVRECKEYLEKASRWESYELDTRIGLKVTAAMEAVQKWENMHSSSTS
ncbi:TTC39/IML2 family protein [Aspergillus affinis]|uniref:TTC39/IML2 family protein n=1 Tax=Aspergillus affinis TaxID=1070780 RepID=UPI0022FE063E|nr:outer membrane protein iml2 [Aspergillus affinis]KAI9041608.1 outer membrane protein iml2 [Aspergillus affinis]